MVLAVYEGRHPMVASGEDKLDSWGRLRSSASTRLPVLWMSNGDCHRGNALPFFYTSWPELTSCATGLLGCLGASGPELKMAAPQLDWAYFSNGLHWY